VYRKKYENDWEQDIDERMSKVTEERHHDNSLLILWFDWEIRWACIVGGRNKARETLHERGFLSNSR
jgi:hypothetical protein